MVNYNYFLTEQERNEAECGLLPVESIPHISESTIR